MNQLQPVLSGAQVIALQAEVRRVAVEESLYDYLLDIVEATRRCADLQVGVSTRGAGMLPPPAALGGRSLGMPMPVIRPPV